MFLLCVAKKSASHECGIILLYIALCKRENSGNNGCQSVAAHVSGRHAPVSFLARTSVPSMM